MYYFGKYFRKMILTECVRSYKSIKNYEEQLAAAKHNTLAETTVSGEPDAFMKRLFGDIPPKLTPIEEAVWLHDAVERDPSACLKAIKAKRLPHAVKEYLTQTFPSVMAFRALAFPEKIFMFWLWTERPDWEKEFPVELEELEIYEKLDPFLGDKPAEQAEGQDEEDETERLLAEERQSKAAKRRDEAIEALKDKYDMTKREIVRTYDRVAKEYKDTYGPACSATFLSHGGRWNSPEVQRLCKGMYRWAKAENSSTL